ncbi:MAG: hypothetical protein ACI9U5_001018 [Colwellia sp.]|jgi:hypothetical protein
MLCGVKEQSLSKSLNRKRIMYSHLKIITLACRQSWKLDGIKASDKVYQKVYLINILKLAQVMVG